MKSFAKLLAVAVALAIPTLAAHADPITGEIQLEGGVTSYNASSITFSNDGNDVFNNSTDTIGTLSVFDGGALVFGPTAGQTYTVDGTNYVGTTLFTITNPGAAGDTLTFTLTDITSFTYDAGGDDGLQGTGTGTFTMVDPTTGQTSTADGLFTLSSQENTDGLTENVSFSSTASSLGVAPTPEPSSLLLLGTGLLGSAGLLYRRNRTSVS